VDLIRLAVHKDKTEEAIQCWEIKEKGYEVSLQAWIFNYTPDERTDLWKCSRNLTLTMLMSLTAMVLFSRTR